MVEDNLQWKTNIGGRQPLVGLADQCHTQIFYMTLKIMRPKEFFGFKTISTIFFHCMLPSPLCRTFLGVHATLEIAPVSESVPKKFETAP